MHVKYTTIYVTPPYRNAKLRHEPINHTKKSGTFKDLQ